MAGVSKPRNLRMASPVEYTDNLRQVLECPICLELPTDSPIYACKTGHIVCKTCYPKLKSCGLCKAPFLGTRSFTAEEIVKTIKIKCRNNGCLEVLRGADHSAHLKICQFRAIPCFETRTLSCNGALVELDEFEKHLLHTHKTHGVDEPTQFHEFTELSNDVSTDERWPLFYFRYEGKLFLRHLLIENGTLYWWVTMVGKEEDAKKYRISLSIYRKSDRKTSIQWSHVVHSNQLEFKEIQALGDCANIHKDVLTTYCRETENFKYALSTRYVLFKVDPSQDKVTFAGLKPVKK